MTVRWNQLPLGLDPKATKPRRTLTGKGIYRCHACGNEETAWARAERHADATHHVRIDCLPLKG